MKQALAGFAVIAAMFLAGCPTTFEGAVARARQTQAVAEEKVNNIVGEMWKTMCDLDVRRVDWSMRNLPGFTEAYWENCGMYDKLIDSAIQHRIDNPRPDPKAATRGSTANSTTADNRGASLAGVAPHARGALTTHPDSR